MKTKPNIGILVSLLFSILFCSCKESVVQPNIVLIVADDMTYRDCEPYGNPDIITPNIAQLAEEGISFDNMCTSTAMCVPTRAQLWTGIYPVRSGCYPNHAWLYEGLVTLPVVLKEHGYRVAGLGKSGDNPNHLFPLDLRQSGGDRMQAIEQFIDESGEQPFMIWYGSNSPHGPWNKGNREAYNASELALPPYLIDTRETREELVKYYAEITDLDREVGEIRSILEKRDIMDNTLFIFTSEQGASLPYGGKWSCYENSLKTAFIARWPGKIKPNTRTSAMTQYVDFAPTIVELIGSKPEKVDVNVPDTKGYTGYDGKSFLNVLLGKQNKHHEYLYGCHTMINVGGGTPEGYPIRSVRDERWKYIRNLNHEAEFQCGGARGKVVKSWQAKADTSPEIQKHVHTLIQRPYEELYDLENDPYEMNNLADSSSYHKELCLKLGKVLDNWMEQQGDEGMPTELAAKERHWKIQKAAYLGVDPSEVERDRD